MARFVLFNVILPESMLNGEMIINVDRVLYARPSSAANRCILTLDSGQNLTVAGDLQLVHARVVEPRRER